MFRNKLCTILGTAILIISLISCGSGNVQISSNGAHLLSISITPSDPRIAQSTAEQFTAIGYYSDGTTRDVTPYVSWSSADASVATFSTTGTTDGTAAAPSGGNRHAFAYGKNAGSTTISATSGSTSGTTTLTVTNATLVSISVTPINPSISTGKTEQFSATGAFSDNTTQDLTTQVTWASSNTSVATISASGLASSITVGTATVTATALSGSISGNANLTVTTAASTTPAPTTLVWEAPTTHPDGTLVTDIAGYKIHYGTSSGNYTAVIDAGNVTQYVIVNKLAPGTYYFVTTAYYTSGIESGYSNEISMTF